MTPRAGDEKVQSCRSWDISHPSVSVLYSWEMRRRLYFRFDRLCSHGCPQFHRAALPFAGPQPAIAMDWRAWMNTQTILSEMCAHPTLGLSVSSAQGLPCTSCHEGYTASQSRSMSWGMSEMCILEHRVLCRFMPSNRASCYSGLRSFTVMTLQPSVC